MLNIIDKLSQEAPVTRLRLIELDEQAISLWLLRLDDIHPQISGNKGYKLKYNLQYAMEQGYKSVLSFGGAYSNHIHALAWAAHRAGLKSIGVIRGEPEYAANPTLSDAQNWAMHLHFVNRETYRERNKPQYQAALCAAMPKAYQPVYLIPEGGANALAIQGCKEILSPSLIQALKPDQVILACGTGATLAGVALSQPKLNILGIPVLKKADFLYDDIRKWMQIAGEQDPKNWSLDLQGHFGGYAKCPQEIIQFMQRMEQEQGVVLDQVYTAKMLLRVVQRVQSGAVQPGSTLLVIHSGGLQGRRSIFE